MKKLAVLVGLCAAAAFLAGCASPTQLRAGKADIDVMTDKTAERVAGCIGDEFQKANVFVPFAPSTTFSTQPTTAGFTISGTQSGPLVTGGTDTIILVDVERSDGRTHVTMFDHILAGQGKWVTLIRGCL